MGAYLNKPVTEKHSETGEGAGLRYGATCMQGWRVNQEDAHNCTIDLAEGWSLFAVYDGHGGSEVSKYTSLKFPDFLKDGEFWKNEDLTKALEKIFIEFDDHIRSDAVMKELQKLATEGKEKPARKEHDSDDENDRIQTIEESRMPLEQILARYGFALRANPDPKSILSAICQDDSEEDGSGRDKKKRHSKSPAQAQAKRAKTEADSDDPEAEPVAFDHESLSDPKPSSEQANEKKTAANPEESKDAPEEPQPPITKEKTKKSAGDAAEGPEAVEADESDEDDADFDGGDEEEEEEEEDDEAEDEEAEDEEEDDNEEIFLPGGGDTPGDDSGTTACVCLMSKTKIVVANAGDSRAVLSRGGVAVNLSEDHKPEDDKERTRIEKAGGCVNGDGRVNGGLNLSRAFGDHCYKKSEGLNLEEQMITALPDVMIQELKPEDEFVVIACDGIWNSLESQEVVDFVKEGFGAGKSCQQIAEELCDRCLADSTAGDGTGCDNMTVIVTEILH